MFQKWFSVHLQLECTCEHSVFISWQQYGEMCISAAGRHLEQFLIHDSLPNNICFSFTASYCELFIQSPDFLYITVSNHYNCLNFLYSHQQDLFTKSLV
jgi:hypothetical protein